MNFLSQELSNPKLLLGFNNFKYIYIYIYYVYISIHKLYIYTKTNSLKEIKE